MCYKCMVRYHTIPMPLFYPQKSLCVYTHIYLFIKYGEVFNGLSVMLSKASVHAEFKNKKCM